MAQEKFTFSKHFQSMYPEKYIPPRHFEVKDEFIDNLVKRGYLVKDINIKKVTLITAFCARANVPLETRKSLQKKLK